MNGRSAPDDWLASLVAGPAGASRLAGPVGRVDAVAMGAALLLLDLRAADASGIELLLRLRRFAGRKLGFLRRGLSRNGFRGDGCSLVL